MNLLAPIYKGGALKTQVEIKTAGQKQAIADYASIGLRAFGEVENALAAELAARDRERILTQALADNQRAFEIVQTQYRVGSTDMRSVTQRQLAVNASQSALIQMQTEQRIQRVNLHLALGGSFTVRPCQLHNSAEPSQVTPNLQAQRRASLGVWALRIGPYLGMGSGGVAELTLSTYIVCDGNAIPVPAARDDLGDLQEQPFLDLEEVRPVARVDVGERSRRRARRRRAAGSARGSMRRRSRTGGRASGGCRRARGASAPTSSRSAARRPGGTRTCRAPMNVSTLMFAIWLLGTLTTVRSSVRMRVERRPMCSTVPSIVPTLR